MQDLNPRRHSSLLRDQAGLIRLPRRVEEHVQSLRSQGGETLSPADDIVLLQYFNKTHWTKLKKHHAETSELPLGEIECQLQRPSDGGAANIAVG